MKKLLISLTALALTVAVSQNASAQADIGMKAAGFEVGFVSPENFDGTVGIGVFANLGQLSPDIAMTSHLNYWSKSERLSGFGEASVRDVSLLVRGKYQFRNSSPKFKPFAGAGLGLHFLKSEVTIPDQDIGGIIIPGMTVNDSATKLGLDVGGGFATPLSPKTNFVTEMWYGIVSDVSQLSLKVGLEFQLAQ